MPDPPRTPKRENRIPHQGSSIKTKIKRLERGAERGNSPKVRILEELEGLKRGNTQKLKQSLLSNLVTGEVRDVDSSLPAKVTSKAAGPSKAEGRVARRRIEARKASAFLERWLQAGENTKGSSTKPGKEQVEDDRCVGSGEMDRTQDREEDETNAGKNREEVGEEGREVVNESNRERNFKKGNAN